MLKNNLEKGTETCHTEKTEAYYQEVLKVYLDMAMHSNRALGIEEPINQLKLEAEWFADEVAYGLEIGLTDAQLADIDAEVKAGRAMDEIGSDETEQAIEDAWDAAKELNNVVTIEHDCLSIVQNILEKVANGSELSKALQEWAGIIAQFLNSRHAVEGRWIETAQQKHDRFLAYRQK